MGWSELLTTFVSARGTACAAACERLRAELDDLLASLDGLEDARWVEGDEPWQLRLARVRRRALEIDRGPIRELGALMPWKRGQVEALRKQLDDALQALALQAAATQAGDTPPGPLAARAGLHAAAQAVDALAAQGRRRQLWRVFWLKLVLLLPLGAAALLGVRTLWLDGVSVQSVLPLQPEGALVEQVQATGRSFVLAESWRERFLTAFEKHYFRRPSDFERLFAPGKNGPGGSQRFQVVLRNQDRYDPLFVSSVGVAVRALRQPPFPWERIDPTPRLRVRALADPGRVELLNEGCGPALDVRWELTAGGQQLARGATDLLPERLVVDLVATAEGVGQIGVTPGGRFDTSLFRALPSAADDDSAGGHGPVDGSVDPERLVLSSAGTFEAIDTPERLAAFTTVVRGGPYTLRVTYLSLRGARHDVEHIGTLPADRAFYLKQGLISERLPRETRMVARGFGMEDLDELPARGMGFAPRVMGLANPLGLPAPAASPTGEDLLVTELSVDMEGMGRGLARYAAAQPDVFLNPSGALVLYVDLVAPANGDYEIIVELNGGTVERIRTQCLVPERLRLASPQDEVGWQQELQRWRAAPAGGASAGPAGGAGGAPAVGTPQAVRP